MGRRVSEGPLQHVSPYKSGNRQRQRYPELAPEHGDAVPGVLIVVRVLGWLRMVVGQMLFRVLVVHAHLCCTDVAAADGKLISRTGRSNSPGRAGASSPSVSRNPFRARAFVHRVSSAPM
jgi:hypothetical protein